MKTRNNKKTKMTINGKPISLFRWYGFDIDGTIADNSKHSWVIDKPIKPMVDLMKRLHKMGCDVRILSGRTGDFRSDDEMPMSVKEHIWSWCDKHLGFRPALTGRKDSMMEALFDDRACQVICNKGITYEECNERLADCLEEAIKRLPNRTIEDKSFIAKCLDVLKDYKV